MVSRSPTTAPPEVKSPKQIIAQILTTEDPSYGGTSTYGFNIAREQDNLRDKLAEILQTPSRMSPKLAGRYVYSDTPIDTLVDQMLEAAREKARRKQKQLAV